MPLIERLECRRLFAVSLDANGYTVVTPADDSNVYFVSFASGLDTNDGRSPDAPLRTVSKAMNLVRNGSADQILLKRGDTFPVGVTSWRLSGRSAAEPMVFGAYGDGARPLIASGSGTGFGITGASSVSVDHLLIQGIEFFANTYTGVGTAATGIGVYMNGTNFQIEDCYVHGYKDNVVLGMIGITLSDVALRKNVIADAFSVSVGHSQGLYAESTVKGLVLEGNVFDHNGWNENVPGAGATVFNHNVYVQTGATNIVATDNIFAGGALHGAMIRPGGVVQNNVFIGNAIGLGIFGPGRSVVCGNVILDGRDLPTLPQGLGINAEGNGGTLIYDNVIAHDDSDNTANTAAIQLNSQSKTVALLKNVIYDWRRGLRNNSAGPTWVTANDIRTKDPDKPLVDHPVAADKTKFHYADNTYFSPRSTWFTVQGANVSRPTWTATFSEGVSGTEPRSFPDPDRTAASYTGAYGRGSSGVYVANARLMSRQQPLTFYSAAAFIGYIREGFGLSKTPATRFPFIPTPGLAYSPYRFTDGKTTTKNGEDIPATGGAGGDGSGVASRIGLPSPPRSSG